MDVTTKISSRGQLVIPVDLRKRYKLEAGTPVRVGERDGQITVTPNPPDPYDAFIAMRGIMAHIEEDVGGWWMEEKRKEREREDLQIEQS